MTAIFHGPFIGDLEFEPRQGIDRPTLGCIMEECPNLLDTENDGTLTLAINDCLDEICHGVGIAEGEWANWFSIRDLS
jgi:hypothetical protein